MKKKILIFSIILAVSFGACFAANSDTIIFLPKVKKAIKYAKNNKTRKASELYSGFSEAETSQFADYLEKNPGEIAPIYFVLVSDDILRTDKEKAAFFYNFGKVRALEDANMCVDKSAAEQISNYALIAPKTVEYLKSKTYDYKFNKALFEKVIEKDNQTKQRVSPIWACEYGNEILFKKPKLIPESEFPKIIKLVQDQAKGAADKIKEFNDKND